jgi:sortase B
VKYKTTPGGVAVRIANAVVNAIILILVMLLFSAGCYALWDSEQIYKEADAKRYEVYKPSEYDSKLFEDLKVVNPDIFSWLTVYGTNIDYPVVQYEDNMRYVSTDAEGNFSLSGAIFLDYKNKPDFSDFNSIFYGHHMEKKRMFGDIELFADKTYFEERRYGNLYYNGADHGVEFFAFLHADAYNTKVFRAGVQGSSEQQAYLNMLLSMSSQTRDVPVTIDDRIVLLSTCSTSPTNGRDILVGRITDEVYEDIFFDEKVPLSVDSILGVWARLPLWALIIVSLLPLGLIPIIIVLVRRRHRRRDESEGNYFV